MAASCSSGESRQESWQVYKIVQLSNPKIVQVADAQEAVLRYTVGHALRFGATTGKTPTEGDADASSKRRRHTDARPG